MVGKKIFVLVFYGVVFKIDYILRVRVSFNKYKIN